MTEVGVSLKRSGIEPRLQSHVTLSEGSFTQHSSVTPNVTSLNGAQYSHWVQIELLLLHVHVYVIKCFCIILTRESSKSCWKNIPSLSQKYLLTLAAKHKKFIEIY